MKKVVILGCLLLSSNIVFAAENIINKTAKPNNIIAIPSDTGVATFNLASTDFPQATWNKMKNIKEVSWTTTSYPNKGNETVKLCYFKPYSSINPTACINIKANATDKTDYFNNYTFDKGAKFTISHQVSSGSAPAYPSGSDSLIIRYSY